MVISSSAASMAAKTTRSAKFTQTNESLAKGIGTGEVRYSANSFEASYEKTVENSLYEETSAGKKNTKEDRDATSVSDGNTDLLAANGFIGGVQDEEEITIQSLLRQIRSFLLDFRHRLSLMIFGASPYGRNYLGEYSTANSLGGTVVDLSSGQNGYTVWNVTNYSKATYEEEESMTFSSVGKAVTADGRTIEFNMEIEMSRAFCESSEVLTKQTEVVMTDPLVISLDSNPVSVSDQKWRFDIDGNGTDDGISLLSKGSGFLAFDKNEDGKINNGTELFGAKTGNGFRELAEYDEDGNGWIDENDEVYSKLSVWIKDDTGNDKLIGLKQANVGAIYLANLSTDFSMKSERDNSHNAQLRRTGMYLTEDGMANTIQQLDMVNSLIS
ncbi:MAG: hypothetical protein E7259_09170 [Lachnospiraceae bacterium]|nr:hypothetical protein [Lachnospiraceae bacterium]